MQSIIERLPERIRLLILTIIYACAGGLTAVAFMFATNYFFDLIWQRLTALNAGQFLLGSFLSLTISASIAGALMSLACPSAAGSGVPQLKSAYWLNFGVTQFRAVLVKFIGGVITLAGGSSLGREGPTVFLAGGLCANIAGWLRIDKRKRRQAAVTGAAAGLAAAFNTPLAAISFILEEILGDLSNRVVGSVTLASVTGAFIVYALVGSQPSFFMPPADASAWNMYLAVPAAAILAALAGLVFQCATLYLRARARGETRLPRWLHLPCGALVVWLIGSMMYLSTGRLGVFGLGYADLSHALTHGITWKLALALAVAKLIATIASYGTGGCGGIFAPTLFIGAMCGFATAGVASFWLPLEPTDHFVLAAVGMSACFGCVVRAPVTAILMIFEMTHQFGMVPALMLGTLFSQIIARFAGSHNFYDAILAQDGHKLHKIIPPKDIQSWHELPVSAFANRRPICITSAHPDYLSATLEKHPYRFFPVVINNIVQGVTTRSAIRATVESGVTLELEKPVVFHPDQSLREIEPALIQSNYGLFLVSESPLDNLSPVVAVFTLNDLLRAQTALLE